MNYRANNFASESVERAYAANKISLVVLLFTLAKMSKISLVILLFTLAKMSKISPGHYCLH